MRRLTILIAALLISTFGFAQSAGEPLWLVAPAISPDGMQIAFSYKGVLYVVPSIGGEAKPLTTNREYAKGAVWTPDSRRIAYASDMYGNFDIFTIDVAGGEPTRITQSSASEIPYAFTPRGDSIVFRALEMPANPSALFYTGWTTPLYITPANGGLYKLFLPVPAANLAYSPDGAKILFEDVRGNEDELRKHQVSSMARDIWSYSPTTKQLTHLVQRVGEDRNPVYDPNGKDFYFLSERDGGSFNVFTAPLDSPNAVKQITRFERNPIRSLSISRTGLLCFAYDGRIYTLPSTGGEPKPISIRIANSTHKPEIQNMTLRSASDGVLSPDGKEVAFVARGNVYVSSVEHGMTKQITNTPAQERSVQFAPDGRTLVYAGERNGSWNLYTATIVHPEEKSFAGATDIREDVLLESDRETFQPLYSPDGKEIAFLEDRTKIRVINLATKQVRTVTDGSQNYSYADGDIAYQWSPDSKWFVLAYNAKRRWPNSDIGLVRATGSEPIFNLTQSGYTDTNPRFMMKGDVIIWHSDRNGLRAHASWGAQEDVYAFFINKAAYDKYRLTPFEIDLAKNAQKEDKKQESNAKKEDKKGKKNEKKEEPSVPELNIDLNDVEDRIVRLTIHSSDLADAIVTPDGESLYYLCSFEGKYNLWKTNLRKKTTKKILDVETSSGTISLDKKHENMLIAAGGKLVKIDFKSEKQTNVSFAATVQLDAAREREYIFHHAWRQVKAKFYRSDLHGVDWEYYRGVYEKFLPHINNNYDFADMLSELLGELNASHTGSGYRPVGLSTGPRTATLGIFFDYNYPGPGVKVTEILRGGPLDLDNCAVTPGSIITSIDGHELKDYASLCQLLDRKEGKRIRIGVSNGAAATQVVKPASMGILRGLMYERWVEQRRREVDSLSGGRLGYVHIQGMNTPSFRTVYSDLFGRYNDREGVIIDTRYNGGGHLHEDIEVLFSGKKYLDLVPREQWVSEHPRRRWKKPSVMLVGEANYSNAHGTPWVYKTQGLGKIIGKPIPGTMTSVWWETQIDPTIYFGVPIVGYIDRNGNYLENQQLYPDVDVPYDYQRAQLGHDSQIERAVQILLEEVDAAKTASPWPAIESRFR